MSVAGIRGVMLLIALVKLFWLSGENEHEREETSNVWWELTACVNAVLLFVGPGSDLSKFLPSRAGPGGCFGSSRPTKDYRGARVQARPTAEICMKLCAGIWGFDRKGGGRPGVVHTFTALELFGGNFGINVGCCLFDPSVGEGHSGI
jgi:hypothetical protein